MAAKTNLTMTSDVQVTAREIDFVTRFARNWQHLRDILGIMRPIKKQPGTVLKSKTASVTLAQSVGDDVERLELIGGLIPGVQEVAAVHTLKIEAVQLLDELGKLGVHVNVLSKGETIAMSRCAPACACG